MKGFARRVGLRMIEATLFLTGGCSLIYAIFGREAQAPGAIWFPGAIVGLILLSLSVFLWNRLRS